jgi:L-seryl-tRNA(Ser) seleniumtransferase
MVGFVEEVELRALVAIGRKAGVPVLFDQGTGDWRMLRDAIAAGVDVATCSGDKTIGGPQAGIVLGTKEWVSKIRRHPLARALRIDKLTLAGLEATLALWHRGRGGEIPAVAMIAESEAQVRIRAEKLGKLLGSGVPHSIVRTESAAGGGTRPDEPIASAGVRVEHPNAESLAAALRTGEPPVVARIVDGAVTLDLRTVADAELDPLASAIQDALKRGAVT